jgi:hypothetical protein
VKQNLLMGSERPQNGTLNQALRMEAAKAEPGHQRGCGKWWQ